MKKFLALALVICMLIAVFTSCSSGGTESTGKNNETGNNEVSTGTESEPDTEPVSEGTTTESEDTSSSGSETEPNTESDSEPNSESGTQPDTESTSESESETAPITNINFNGEYAISGKYTDMFEAVVKSEKLPKPKDNADSVIYIGDANADIVTAAKALLTKPNDYYDFAILAMNDDLAIYANSEYAIETAIAYLIENYTTGGYISVPIDFTYTSLADLPNVIIGGNTLENVTVVAKNDLQDIASGLAEDLTLLTGFRVAYGESADGASIELSVTGSGDTVGNSYTVSYSNQTLYITAQNKITLAYAISSFMKNLKDGVEITEGFSETYTLKTKMAAATNIDLFKYCGTWQATDATAPTTMVSYWDAAYVEVDFTGNAITLLFSSPTTFLYRIDGGAYTTVSNFKGEYTVYANGGGTHTVRVLYNDKGQSMYFAGVKAGEDVTLSRTPDKKYYVQFVGDSISDATNSFSHNSADLINWDYSVVACEALSLVRNQGYWRYNNGFVNNVLTEGSMAWHFNKNFGVVSVGMEDAFFKLGIPNKWKDTDPRFADVAANYYTEKYNFNFETGNTPDIVFIFLGTNDLSSGSPASAVQAFKRSYVTFVEKLFETYGSETEIVVMQSLSTSNTENMYDTSHPRYVAIREIAAELKTRYPDNVTFLDENTLFSWGVDISSDGTHPSAEGYATLSTKVAQWLEKNFK